MAAQQGVRRWASALAIAVLLWSCPAAAQTSAADVALSDFHVREARRLMSRDRVMEGCSEYLAADRAFSRVPILVELADCYSAAGYPGTAFETLQRALALAKQTGDRRAAEELASRIGGGTGEVQQRSGTLVVVVEPRANVPGLSVTVDGHPIDTTARVPRPVDPALVFPGTHWLNATAPGYKPVRVEFALAPNEQKTIAIHQLELEPEVVEGAPRGADLGKEVPTGPRTGLGIRAGVTLTTVLFDAPVVGKGALLVTSPRISYAFGRASIFARGAFTYVDPPDKVGSPHMTAQSPTVGVAYGFPLGKRNNLGLSLGVAIPTGNGGGNDSARADLMVNGLMNLAGQAPPSFLILAPAADLDMRFGAVELQAGVRMFAGRRLRGERVVKDETVILAALRARVTVFPVDWIGPYFEPRLIQFLLGLGEATALSVAGGVIFAPSKTVQLSAGYARPIKGLITILDPHFFELGLAVRF